MSETKHGYRSISAALSVWRGGIEGFIKQLDEDGVIFLSYSKLSTVQSCEYRYLLEYVQGVRVRQPGYFKKGRAFHEGASMAYQQMGRGKLDLAGIERKFGKRFDTDDQTHLRNAIRLLIDNAHKDYELVATEMPFVLSLGRGLPPLIGVIDLVLRKGDTFFVVDHKTGKNLYEQDADQLLLYREHIRRTFKPKRCLACFDEYRWVNNLDRIRKPAFRRTPTEFNRWSWPNALRRMKIGFRTMRRIEKTGRAESGYECYMCQFQNVCPMASFGW